MDGPEEQPVSGAVKASRFGCGAVLGLFFGLFLVAKWSIAAYGAAAAIVAVAAGVCGWLALKHGDAFWYDLFARDK